MKGRDFIACFIKEVWIQEVFWIPWTNSLKLLDSLDSKWITFISNIHENNSLFILLWKYLFKNEVNFVIDIWWPWITNSITWISSLYMENVPCVILWISWNSGMYWLWDHHDSSSITWVNTLKMLSSCTCLSEKIFSIDSLAWILLKSYLKSKETSKPVFLDISEDVLEEDVGDFFDFSAILWKCNFKENYTHDYTRELQIELKSPLFLIWKVSDSTKLSKILSDKWYFFIITPGNKEICFNSKFFLWYASYVKQLRISWTIDLFSEIVCLWDNIEGFHLEPLKEKMKHKHIYHIGDSASNSRYGLWKNYKFNIVEDVLACIRSLELCNNKIYEALSNKITFINNLINEKQKSVINKYYSFYDVLNNYTPTDSIYFISAGQSNINGFRYFRPLNQWVYIAYPWIFFSMWSSLASIWYALGSWKSVNTILGEWEFLMNWNEVLTAKNLGVNMNIFIFNNGGFKSLKDISIKKGLAHQNNWIFDSIDVNFKYLCKSYGINYVELTDFGMLKNIILNKNTWINMIEIKV